MNVEPSGRCTGEGYDASPPVPAPSTTWGAWAGIEVEIHAWNRDRDRDLDLDREAVAACPTAWAGAGGREPRGKVGGGSHRAEGACREPRVAPSNPLALVCQLRGP